MLVLLFLLLVGVVCAKTRVIDGEGNKKLTRMALIVPQSAMILNSVINVDLGMTAGKIFTVLGASFVMYALLLAMGLLVRAVLGRKTSDGGLYCFMLVFGNVGFMGFPVISAIFGSTAVFYAALANIPFNLLTYSVGLMLLKNDGSRFRFDWSLLLNAPMAATVAALALLASGLHVPEPLAEGIGMLGDMIVPLSMLIIGASLGDMGLKETFGDWRSYVLTLGKLLLAPLVVHLVLSLFVRDALTLGVLTVLSGMPVAAISVMFTIEHGGNAGLASRGVFISSLLSVLTIPLICGYLL